MCSQDQCLTRATYHWYVDPRCLGTGWDYCDDHHAEAIHNIQSTGANYFRWEKLATEEERVERLRWMEEISS